MVCFAYFLLLEELFLDVLASFNIITVSGCDVTALLGVVAPPDNTRSIGTFSTISSSPDKFL